MKRFQCLLFTITLMTQIIGQKAPTSIDLTKYSGKWFVVGVIPTRFDKNWEQVTETYTLNKKGNIDIFTTYVKQGKAESDYVTSKGFPNKKSNYVKWKVQFVWPFRADYVIEEIDEAYSYTVVGHPKKKFLYIMNRTGQMDEQLYNSIAKRAADRGYDMKELRKLIQN